MKSSWSILTMGVVVALISAAIPASAVLEVSASVAIHSRADFEAPLAAQGTWVTVGSYGRCWRPGHVVGGWRPYCDGEWVWTDAGWYWESDEPWGWACYHYGSWVYDNDGWAWVPDVQWAPAWVSWRYGGGYVGWAPCSPRGFSVGIAPAFVFVESGHFHERFHPNTVIINNTTVIQKTKVIGDVREETRQVDGTSRKVNFNQGPPLAEVQKATAQKIRVTKIDEAVAHTPAPRLGNAKPADAKAAETKPANVPKTAVAPADRERVRAKDEPRTSERERERAPVTVPPTAPVAPRINEAKPGAEPADRERVRARVEPRAAERERAVAPAPPVTPVAPVQPTKRPEPIRSERTPIEPGRAEREKIVPHQEAAPRPGPATAPPPQAPKGPPAQRQEREPERKGKD